MPPTGAAAEADTAAALEQLRGQLEQRRHRHQLEGEAIAREEAALEQRLLALREREQQAREQEAARAQMVQTFMRERYADESTARTRTRLLQIAMASSRSGAMRPATLPRLEPPFGGA